MIDPLGDYGLCMYLAAIMLIVAGFALRLHSYRKRLDDLENRVRFLEAYLSHQKRPLL